MLFILVCLFVCFSQCLHNRQQNKWKILIFYENLILHDDDSVAYVCNDYHHHQHHSFTQDKTKHKKNKEFYLFFKWKWQEKSFCCEFCRFLFLFFCCFVVIIFIHILSVVIVFFLFSNDEKQWQNFWKILEKMNFTYLFSWCFSSLFICLFWQHLYSIFLRIIKLN